MGSGSARRIAGLLAGAAIIVGAAGAIGAPAQAAPQPDEGPAPTSGAGFEDTASGLLEQPEVAAVATDGAGSVLLYTTASADDLGDEAHGFVEGHDNVRVITLDAPFEALDGSDVVGGAGYLAGTVGTSDAGVCSIGFPAFTPAGGPAVITAGHCTLDGERDLSRLTLPSGDPAGGGAFDNSDVVLEQRLGTVAFSQFGGPGNTPGDEGDMTSVDPPVRPRGDGRLGGPPARTRRHRSDRCRRGAPGGLAPGFVEAAPDALATVREPDAMVRTLGEDGYRR